MKSAATDGGFGEPPLNRKHGRILLATLSLLALVVCGVAISRQSFWIDESCTALKAGQPTLAKWWQEMMLLKGSDLQMPLYMWFTWGWEKLVGLNEFALRAGNVPWFLIGFIVMTRVLATAPRLQQSMALVALSSPFVWYYLNEARPYAMQVGMSLVVFFALYQLGLPQPEPRRERSWIMVLCFGSLVLAASNLLAMLWLGAYLGAAALSTPEAHCRRLAREYLLYWGLTLALLLIVGLYYLWTLKIGAGAAITEATDLRNVLFVAYELFGFSGLGPGRMSIRTGGLGAFQPWLPWLAIYGMLLLIVLVQGWRQIAASTPRRTRLCWAVAFAVVAGFILAVGVTVRFRVLGRHFAPALPLVLFVLGTGVTALWNRRGWLGRMVIMAFLGLSLVSSLNLRWSERHAKDDYRGAAALSHEALAHGESVWWNACLQGAEVYHLPVAQEPGDKNMALMVVNPGEGFLRSLPQPDLVLVSRPDLGDNTGALEHYLVEAGFHRTATLTAFTAWRAPGK